MNRLPVVLAAASFFAAGMHFARAGETGVFVTAMLFPFLFMVRRRWARYVIVMALWAAAAMWMAVLLDIAQARILLGAPWARFASIMIVVLALTVMAAVRVGRMRFDKEGASPAGDAAALASFLITAFLLVLARAKAPFPVLLLDRLADGLGWTAILLLSVYAAWIAGRLVESHDTSKLRLRIWIVFAAVFFAQLFLGLSGLDSFLMTGRLHVPVPAMVIAGPLYRGEGFFMPVLFASTVLLVGPAWCSHLCYFGAWDALAASKRKRPARAPVWLPATRPALLTVVIAAALLMRATGVSGYVAASSALGFGAVGMGVMVLVSRRKGYMAHCTAWCPLGLVAALGGKLSPFRIRINEACTDCGACTASCRYDALRPEHVRRRSPGINCTLCGDCLASCRGGFIGYRFPWLSPDASRMAFIAILAALHAVFLGLARI